MSYKKTVLKSGVRVLTETFPKTRAVFLGFWLPVGSRDENPRYAGISHLLEHMVFKGTKKRSAFKIAQSLEAVGGDLNAFTTKEGTCFHTVSLKENARMAFDVLADLVTQATFPENEYEKEKQVIAQEIFQSYDDHGEYIFDHFIEKCFPGKPIGHSILGTVDSLTSISRKDLQRFYKENYTSQNLMITATGAISHEEVVAMTEDWFKKKSGLKKPRLKKDPMVFPREKPRYKKVIDVAKKNSEQVHILFGLPTASFKDKERLESYFVSTLLGGGMTSKLFQSVRERKGLAYSTYSYLYSFDDASMSFFYAGTDEANYKAAVKLMLSEFKKVRNKGISKSDLKMYKTQIKGSMVLGADDLEGRMNSLATNETLFGEYRSIEGLIEEIEKVSQESVKRYIDRYFNLKKMGAVIFGNIDEKPAKDWLKKALAEV